MQYNEIEYAEKMIKEGFIGKSYTTDLFILSKYLRHEKNMKKQEHVDYVKDFCSRYLIDYNEVLMGNKIDRAIENGRKFNRVVLFYWDKGILCLLEINSKYSEVFYY
jgi:hypothetical protein